MGVISIRGMSQGDLYNLLQALVNRVLGLPNPRVATTTSRVQVSAFDYAIADQVYNKAAEDNIQATGLTNTTATQFRKVRIEINTAGTVSFKEGAAATAQALAQVPRRTANLCTIGWIQIPNSFTYGTTAFSAAGVTFFSGDPDLGDGAGVPPDDRGISQDIVTSP